MHGMMFFFLQKSQTTYIHSIIMFRGGGGGEEVKLQGGRGGVQPSGGRGLRGEASLHPP